MQNTDTVIPLSSLEKGAAAPITGFSEKGKEISNRLFELGFVNGSIITASGKLALRKEDAECVLCFFFTEDTYSFYVKSAWISRNH